MFGEMNKDDDLQFDFGQSTILIKLTPVGTEIIKLLDPQGRFSQNEEGYFEIFTFDLFNLFKSLLMRNPNGQISDLVDGPILIPSVYLKDKDGLSIKHALN